MKTTGLALLLLALTGCGISQALDATKGIPDRLDKTNDGIVKTNAAVHLQTLAVAQAEMMKPENTEILFPPTGMIPAGQVFADEATPEEIVKLIYVYMKDINAAQPDDSEKDANGHWPAELVKRIDHQKNAKFTAAAVIASLAPQEKIEAIVQNEIDNGGRYEDTAYTVLMLRFLLVRDLLLQESLLTHPLSNPGILNEAVTQMDHLTYIANLPYVEKINIKTIGMLSADDNIVLSVNPDELTPLWQKVDKAFDTDLAPK
jgi:hypothetical protein